MYPVYESQMHAGRVCQGLTEPISLALFIPAQIGGARRGGKTSPADAGDQNIIHKRIVYIDISTSMWTLNIAITRVPDLQQEKQSFSPTHVGVTLLHVLVVIIFK